MTAGRIIRAGIKIGVALAVLGVVYLAITYLQVWHASNQDNRGPADAIIVLGAAQYDGRPSPVLAARLDHAVELYEAGVAPRIVVTGGKREGDRFTEAASSYGYLRRAGVPDEVILREEGGDNTWEQLAAATRFLRDRGVTSAVLVSDDYHAYRLDRIAHEIGLRADVSPVDPNLPTDERIRAMVRETAAVAAGRIIGFRRLVDLDEQLSFAALGG